MPSACAYARDDLRHVGGKRPQHELAEHHVVHDALPVLGAVALEHVRELVGAERFEIAVVDVDVGERLRDRLQHRRPARR